MKIGLFITLQLFSWNNSWRKFRVEQPVAFTSYTEYSNQGLAPLQMPMRSCRQCCQCRSVFSFSHIRSCRSDRVFCCQQVYASGQYDLVVICLRNEHSHVGSFMINYDLENVACHHVMPVGYNLLIYASSWAMTQVSHTITKGVLYRFQFVAWRHELG